MSPMDDRKERPGVKFADCELIGIPLRVTVGERSLADGVVEIQGRREAEATRLPLRTQPSTLQAREWLARADRPNNLPLRSIDLRGETLHP